MTDSEYLCANHPTPDLWFPAGYDGKFLVQVEKAKAICSGCPMRRECAEAGMDEDEGVWGGLVPKERAKLRKAGAA